MSKTETAHLTDDKPLDDSPVSSNPVTTNALMSGGADKIQELRRENSYLAWQNANLADELAFWKYQARYHRALLAQAQPPVLVPPVWEADKIHNSMIRELEEIRKNENKDRYDAQPSHEIGS